MGSLRSIQSEAALQYRKRKRHHSWQSVLARRLDRRFNSFDSRVDVSYGSGEADSIFIFWGGNKKRLSRKTVEEVITTFWNEKSRLYPLVQIKVYDFSKMEPKMDQFMIVDARFCPDQD